MFGQWAQAPLVEVQWFVQSAFSMANFFKKYFVRKNRQGKGELLNCYRKMVQKIVTPSRLLTLLLLGRIYIALSSWLCRDFRNVFLPIGEDQKKSYDLSAGPLVGTASCYGKSGPG